jgi:hypothetical protein
VRKAKAPMTDNAGDRREHGNGERREVQHDHGEHRQHQCGRHGRFDDGLGACKFAVESGLSLE